MNLDENTLKLIQETAVKAAGIELVNPDREPDYVYYLVDRNGGTILRKCGAPPPRDYRLFTLDDVIAAVRWMKAQDGNGELLVFCGRCGVEVVIDESRDRCERLRMELPISHEFATLTRCEAQRDALEQREFISLLRIDLAGCVDGFLVDKFRSLHFSKQVEGESDIKQGREAIGHSVRRELVGGGIDIPDSVTLKVHVYRDLADNDVNIRQQIACVVETDLEEGTFILIPLSGELERARRETDAWVQDYLQGELADMSVLCGSAR